MAAPRGIQERIDWFLANDASGSGMCAQHSWHSLGGNNGNPPAWGCSDANEVYDKVKASGRYWTGTPKRGALVLWKYGSNGHAAICYDDAGTKIATTNPTNDAPNGRGTGVEPIGYPSKWGATSSARIYTDQYNGVRFEIGGSSSTTISHGDVYLSKLKYGQEDSDSVKRLQMHLNGHSLAAPGNIELPITGGYFDQTDTVVRADQTQHGLTFGQSVADPVKGSSVGPKQASHLFSTSCGCAIVNDLPDTPPDSGGSEGGGNMGKVWDDYSGKPEGTLTIQGSADYVPVDAVAKAAPDDGLEFHMMYANLDLTWSGSKDGTIRVKYVRDGGDATGYQDYCVSNGKSDFLIQPIHWEAGQKGVGGKWYINVGGGISKASATTRYVKAGGICYE